MGERTLTRRAGPAAERPRGVVRPERATVDVRVRGAASPARRRSRATACPWWWTGPGRRAPARVALRVLAPPGLDAHGRVPDSVDARPPERRWLSGSWASRPRATRPRAAVLRRSDGGAPSSPGLVDPLAGRAPDLRRRRARAGQPGARAGASARWWTGRWPTRASGCAQLDGIAVTAGPGLVGALLVGRDVRQDAGVQPRPSAPRREPPRGAPLRPDARGSRARAAVRRRCW